MSLFDVTLDLLRQATVFGTRRHELLAENVANADTPAFRARDLSFAQELTLAQQVSARPLQASETPLLELRVVDAPDGPPRADGNDVDIDRQMARIAQNTIYHNVVIQLVSARLKELRTAINGHA